MRSLTDEYGADHSRSAVTSHRAHLLIRPFPHPRAAYCSPNLARTLEELQVEDGEELVVTDPVFTAGAALQLEVRFS